MSRRLLTSALLAVLAGSAGAEIEDNADYELAYTVTAAAHLGLLPTAFLPGPIGTAADAVTIGLEISSKFMRPTLVTADPNPKTPNSPDGCHYSFNLPQKEAEFENLLGLFDIKTLPTNWGALSDGAIPQVGHANNQVKLRVDNPYLDAWESNERIMVFPSGNHRIFWEAATQLDPIFDLVVPFAMLFYYGELKYSKSLLATEPKSAARAAKIGKEFLKNAAREARVIRADVENDLPTVDTVVHEQRRNFAVYDITPPEISYNPPGGTPSPFILEANSFGGERWNPHKDMFRSWIDASDPCDQLVLVGNDAPFLLPLGINNIEWEVLDTGPLGPSNPGRDTVIQQIDVRDTRAPIILAPPSRVIESNTAPSPAQVDIGNAVVFDVADPNPLIDSTAPNSFPVNSRTEVVWTATDASGNADSKSQWVTVKAPGSNRAPSVSSVSGNTLTSQTIDLVLTGNDPDILSGIRDPLLFDIVDEPANGFFVAPLVPYFIEDFRVKPNSTIGDILNNFDNPQAEIYAEYCTGGSTTVPTDFVYSPEFVHVTDEGISYVLDRRWECDTGSTAAVTEARISKWSADGELLTETSDNLEKITRLTLDDNGFVYTSQPQESSLEMFLVQRDADLNRITSWKMEAPSGRLTSSRLDSASGLIYATNKSRVWVYDSMNVTDSEPALLGSLMNGQSFLSNSPSIAGNSRRGYNMETDSMGNFYIVDSGRGQVHKFAPSTFDGATFTPGEHVGWMGRCDSGPGCDDENNRSFGYSCSAATPCTVATTQGSAPGQFDDPIGMALDPEDTLYITDYNNSRVQRFTPLGDFAGEAASECDGTCFVLGDMGRPLDISVNSTQFYVLDRDRDLMHIFETAPFKEITENSVTVTYASDNSFQGTDSFTFRANDGLVDSNLATATINVARDFRPPEAFYSAQDVQEDTPTNFMLFASDPDGIAGVDFNGLDTLSYTIVSPPNHGSLSGTAPNLVYTPDQDYVGIDQFTWQVNDGRFDSEVVAFDIPVTAVNDQPIVRLTEEDTSALPQMLTRMLAGKVVGNGMQAGLGYPAPLMAEFDDPDVGDQHFLQIIWGDGTPIENGDNINPPDPDNPDDGPTITAVGNGTGMIVADHIYMTPGPQTVSVTVIDTGPGNLIGEVEADIIVIPMVDVAMEPIVNAEPTSPGEPTPLVIKISNEPPQDPIPALGANNVVFTGELPEGVELLSAASTKGSCSHDDITTTCQIGTLAPSEEQFITLLLAPDANFNPESFGYAINATSLEPDASKDNTTVVEIQVQSQIIFAGGFE